MKPLAATLAAAALAAGAGCSSATTAPTTTTRAQPIGEQDIAQLRAAFNDADDGPRVVVFFSSACRACDEGSRLLNEMLTSLPGDVTVLAVWEPIDAQDGPPPPAWLDNLRDRRARQLWDPTHVFSRELRRAELAHPSSPPQARWRMSEQPDGILYDTAVLFPPDVQWESTLPAPVYVDGGIARVIPSLRERIVSLM